MTTSIRAAIATAFMSIALAFGPVPAIAQERSGPTPPRLAFVDGDVSFWRPGAEDWAPARVNTALAEGDEVYAADRSNVELQIGSRAFVRAGGDAQIGLETLDGNSMQYRVTNGHAAFDLRRLPARQTIEVDTPRAAFTIDRPGYYRVDVDDRRTTFSARRGGFARVVAESGDESDVRDGQLLVLSDDRQGFDVERVADLDDWDRWNTERTSGFGEEPRSASYAPRDVAGVDDLDRYGDWQDEPRYGRVWRPRDVPPDWAPYSAGRWVYDPYYEWTWVDDAPWGWCPYHYGRWVHTSGFWGWAPGPVVVAPVYAPALVAFFGAPGIGVSVSVGAPFVSWVALGFGEPVIPWWGGPRFVGRPYWGGWGGPRIVNNVVINNVNIVNVRNITHFQNAGVRNAVFGMDRDHFRHGGRPVRVAESPRNLRPLHRLDVRPASQSFMPHEGRGRRPPEHVMNRPTVALRQPRNPLTQLRHKGAEIAHPPTSRPEARVVRPRGGGGGNQRVVEHTQPGVPATPGAVGARDHRDVAPNQRGPMAGASRAPEPPRGRAQRQREGVAPAPPMAGNQPRDLRHQGRATPPSPPRQRALRADQPPAPTRPEPPRSMGHRTREERNVGPMTRTPAPPRVGGGASRPPDERAARRAVPRSEVAPPEPRPQPQAQQHRREPNMPRDAVPTPMPRGDRTRLERPRSAPAQRTVRRERPVDAPRTRREPRIERHAERAAPAPQRHRRGEREGG